MIQQRKLIDPYFQEQIKVDVLDNNGRIVGHVFLLDRDMLPVQRGKRFEKCKQRRDRASNR